MTSIDWLMSVCPSSVVITSSTKTGFSCIANAQKPSGEQGRSYSLTVEAKSGDRIEVSERNDNRILPEFCIERHVNPDKTFCLHFASDAPLRDSAHAKLWWKSLGSYLNNQDYAHKRRKWPVNAQLSHGQAADVQIAMEEIARRHGWQEEVTASIFRKSGWLGGALPRLAKEPHSVVNVRSPCPRGCRRLHGSLRKSSCKLRNCDSNCRKLHLPIIRADCPNRKDIEMLVVLEHERRKLDGKIVDELKKQKLTCCGTMDDCPLKLENKNST
jgi:hypothetical protein